MDIVAPLQPQGLEKVYCRQCNQFHLTSEVEFYDYDKEDDKMILLFRCMNNGNKGDTIFRAPLVPVIFEPETRSVLVDEDLTPTVPGE